MTLEVVGFFAVALPFVVGVLGISTKWTAASRKRFAGRSHRWRDDAFLHPVDYRTEHFSTTPFPSPRRDTVANGRLFGESTYVWLPAKSRKKTRYIILMLQVPENFEGVAAVEIDRNSILVHERSTQSVIKTHAKPFL